MHPGSTRWFLIEVFNADRPLFWAFSFFVLAQSFFICKGVETVPFFHWGMYSAAYPPEGEYRTTGISLNDTMLQIDKLDRIPAGYLQSMLDRYAFLKENSFNDPNAAVIHHRFSQLPALEELAMSRLINPPGTVEKFRQWLCRYLENKGVVVNANMQLISCLYDWDGRRFRIQSCQVIDSLGCHR